jgi:hypothetical protein
MVGRGFRLYLSPIVSSFTFLLFSSGRKTRQTWGPVQGGKVAGCDVVQVVGAGAGRGGQGARGDGGPVQGLTRRDDHHVSPRTPATPKTLQG